jgi:hypothetical protein
MKKQRKARNERRKNKEEIRRNKREGIKQNVTLALNGHDPSP